MSNYIRVVYNEEDRPYSHYPEQLCLFLFQYFKLKAGMKLLEAGCGRGEFLKGFKNLGLDVQGVDLSEEAQVFIKDIPVLTSDIEKEGFPFSEAIFDVVYSKSLLEHFFQPERYLQEAFRVLKPGGLLITLVPDWETNYKIYYDDYTHRTPFSLYALRDIYKIFLFENVNVWKFRQLPIVWRYPAMNYLCAIIAPFVPVRTKIKFLKWSRELMLCGSGNKPFSVTR